MKTVPIVALLSVGVALSAIGCESDSHKEPAPSPAPPPPSAEVTTRQINHTRTDRAMVPKAVQGAFNTDFPGAAIENVRLMSTSAGEPFYQFMFIKNGQAQSARYWPNGATVRG